MKPSIDHEQAIKSIELRLANTSRTNDPIEWALLSYRLGMAQAEATAGPPEENLRKALALYEGAITVLTEQRAPVEHARVVNAAGSAHRLLGDSGRAAELFERAATLLDGRGSDVERASILSNLGLALTETADPAAAVEVFGQALDLLVGDDDEVRRTRVATRHNLAQSLMCSDDSRSLARAADVLQAAESECTETDTPLHLAMVWHSLGVVRKGQGQSDEAVRYFEQSLTIFTATAFPFQHAVAKQNLGLALAENTDAQSARLALMHYEDALAIFDPRLHAAQWQATFSNMDELERKLAGEFPGKSRSDHFAALIAELSEADRLAALRRRIMRLERIPATKRVETMAELAYAALQLDPAGFVAILKTTITVLMELPDQLLESALQAQLNAHSRLEAHERLQADFVLDEAVNAVLFGPQRIKVRDILTEIGWERP